MEYVCETDSNVRVFVSASDTESHVHGCGSVYVFKAPCAKTAYWPNSVE